MAGPPWKKPERVGLIYVSHVYHQFGLQITGHKFTTPPHHGWRESAR